MLSPAWASTKRRAAPVPINAGLCETNLVTTESTGFAGRNGPRRGGETAGSVHRLCCWRVMVGWGTRKVVKPAALGPSDHLPVANACAVAQDNFWRREGCSQRASDNADKGVAMAVRNRWRWERNGAATDQLRARCHQSATGSTHSVPHSLREVCCPFLFSSVAYAGAVMSSSLSAASTSWDPAILPPQPLE